jgi:hypothetical protein
LFLEATRKEVMQAERLGSQSKSSEQSPEMKQKYWYVSGNSSVNAKIMINDPLDRDFIAFNNVFPDQKSAEEARYRIKKLLGE